MFRALICHFKSDWNDHDTWLEMARISIASGDKQKAVTAFETSIMAYERLLENQSEYTSAVKQLGVVQEEFKVVLSINRSCL